MKNKNRIKFAYSCGALITFSLIVFFTLTKFEKKDLIHSESLAINSIPKSEFDSATYSQVSLKNGIKTLIVNKDNQQQIRILVGVKIGLFNDPEFIPGLSHLLEHVLISGGSQHYKDVGGFRKFIRAYGGTIEANIHKYNTIYEISIDEKYYKETMERLADLINNPSFEEDIVQKEIQIIDAEFRGLFPTLDYKVNRVSSLLNGVDNFTANSFPGNKESFYSSRNLTDVTSLLSSYHANFYHPHNISILIVSDIKADDIAKNANETIGDITKKININEKIKNETVDDNKQGYVYNIKDKDFMDNLIIQIPLNNQYPIFAGDAFSSSLIDEIFYGTSNTSLYNKLIKTGDITNLTVMLPDGFGQPDVYSSKLTVTMLLTQTGRSHKEELLNLFFSHFGEINTEENIRSIYLSAESKSRKGRSPIISLNPRTMLERFMYAPIEDITYFSLLSDKQAFTKEIISAVEPNRSTILKFDNSNNHRQVSRYDHLEFSGEQFHFHPIKSSNETTQSVLPANDHPTMDDFSEEEQIYSNTKQLLVRQEKIPFDASFLKVKISSSLKLTGQNDFIYAQTLKKLVETEEITLPLSCLKFRNCIIDLSDLGHFSFELGGNAVEAEDQLNYISSLVKKLYQLDNNDTVIEQTLKEVCDMNFVKISNTQQAFERLTDAYTNENSTLWKNVKNWSCKGINLAGFISFYEKFINESQVTINASNAVPDTRMLTFTQQLTILVSEKSKGYMPTEKKPYPEKNINLGTPVKNGGEMLMSGFISPSNDNRSIALTRMLVPVVDAQYFNAMRHTYNTGYVVETKFDTLGGNPTLVIASTSYVMKAKDIQLLHDKFIADFIKNIQINIPEDIEPLKTLAISELRDSSLLNNSSDCINSNSCKSEFEATVQSITRDELIAFAKSLLAN